MRKFILSVTLVAVFVIAGCAALDRYLLPGPDGTSAAGRLGRAGAPIVDVATGGPWGELGLAAVMLLQNGYILFRRIQRTRAARQAVALAPDNAQA